MRAQSRIRARLAAGIAAVALTLTAGAAVVAPTAPMAQTHASIQTHA
jgi:hypothetical protein